MELKKQRAGLVSELNRLKIELANHLLPQSAQKKRTSPRSQTQVLTDIAVAECTIRSTDRATGQIATPGSF